jgi:hypothetical protein
MDCNCPDDGVHVEIDSTECPFDMKQIQRIAFATRGKVIWDSEDGGGLGTEGVPVADAQADTLADWEARRTAIDDTKIVVTPLIGGDPIITPGEAITEGGGDNSTLNGVEEVNGTNPSKFTCTFKSLSTDQEVQMKSVSCRSSEVYFFLEGGRIAVCKIAGGTTRKGFTMQAYHFSDRGNEGFGMKDKHTMMFSLPAGWSENLSIVKPVDFNPLYDI